MGLISAEGLERLKHHKYQTTGYTVLDTYVMNHFWEAFVKLIPLWMAPNLVTLIGFLCILSSYVLMTFYDVTYSQQLPSSVLLYAAFTHFAYQTLDACDGKHARRTGNTSPLGMLMDHGCDSLTSTILILSITQALGLGHDFNLRMLAFGIWTGFYVATWEEYHTHWCRTQVFNFGVTENQIFAMWLLVMAALRGLPFYEQAIDFSSFSLELRVVFLYGTVSLSVATQVLMVYSCITAANDKVRAVSRLLPIVMLMGALYLMSHYTEVYHSHTTLCMVACAFYFSLCVGRLILASITETDYLPFQWEGLFFYVFLANCAYFRTVYTDLLPELSALALLLLAIACAYFVFAYRIVTELTTALNIGFLSIKPKAA